MLVGQHGACEQASVEQVGRLLDRSLHCQQFPDDAAHWLNVFAFQLSSPRLKLSRVHKGSGTQRPPSIDLILASYVRHSTRSGERALPSVVDLFADRDDLRP